MNVPVMPAAMPDTASPGYWLTVWRRLKKDRVAMGACGVILLLMAMALLGSWLAPQDPYASSMMTRLKPIGHPGHMLGTDELGRDMLSRLMVGARLSLFMGIIARTVRALVADILAQELVVGLKAKGLTDLGILKHVVKNAAPTALAVMGLQLGYLLGGSILIETVFAWPGTGFLLNSAIFQRDLPLLQGTILVLAMFFVVLNLLVDVIQTVLDPRIARG